MTSIDKFLGLNLSETGETNLKLGEASKMKNFRITKDYKLTKMNGYEKRFTLGNPIRGQWIGKLGAEEVHVYVAGGKAYKGTEEIGTLQDAPTTIFEFNGILYFLDGTNFYSYDGTWKTVEGYVPLIKIATTPDGIGTDFEPLNSLTNKVHQTFSSDGVAKEFILAYKGTVTSVLINGEIATCTSTSEKVTFSTAPQQGVDNVDIYYTIDSTSVRNEVLKNIYVTKYGLANDTRIFLYGDKNRVYFSDLGNGVPRVDYIPSINFMDIGSSNEPVTDISRQYDRLIIAKERETYYASYDSITDSTGANIIAFPVYPLNSSHGMVAKGQGQLLDNYVTTIDSSIIMWTNTQSKDERNAEVISQRIQEWLNSKDLTKAITMDYQELKEYWLAIDNQIMIYNYGNSTFYLVEIPEKITSMVDYEGQVFIGTNEGNIHEFGEYLTYGGTSIDAEWSSGFYDFGAEFRRKTMRILWLTLKPWSKTSLDINYISDRDSGEESKEIQNNCFSYDFFNYADMTYNTQRGIKPFRIKMKAKKFAFLKIILKNKKNEKVTINSIAIKEAIGGEVK